MTSEGGQDRQVRSGQVRSGQDRSGQAGQVRSGQVRSAQLRSSQVRSGQELEAAIQGHGRTYEVSEFSVRKRINILGRSPESA